MLASPSLRCCGETVMAETWPLRREKECVSAPERREERVPLPVASRGGESATHCQSRPRPSVLPMTARGCHCSVSRGLSKASEQDEPRTVAHESAALSSAERSCARCPLRPSRGTRRTHVDLATASSRLDDAVDATM